MKKVILEGSLLSQSIMSSKYRSGLVRVAEELAQRMVKSKEIDFYFTNNIYLQNFHSALEMYVRNIGENSEEKIISKKPYCFLEFLKFKALWYKYPWLLPVVKKQSLNKFDLFHSFYYPFTSDIKRSKIKKCITYYDIIPLIREGNPEWIKSMTKKIVKSIESSYAISISNFSKQDLLNYNPKINPNNVFVSHIAANPHLFYPDKKKEKWEMVKNKYQIPDQYFFCMASSDPRKNVEHVIKSFVKLILQHNIPELKLVLAGSTSTINPILKKLNLASNILSKIIIPSSLIDDEDLASVYSNALCFIYMSVYEGFGLPALEAMQCGTPTISSNNSSIPEVVGNAGVLISPYDEDALAQSMLKICNDEGLQSKYSELGIKRATEFSWEKTVNQYETIFSKILNQKE